MTLQSAHESVRKYLLNITVILLANYNSEVWRKQSSGKGSYLLFLCHTEKTTNKGWLN